MCWHLHGRDETDAEVFVELAKTVNEEYKLVNIIPFHVLDDQWDEFYTENSLL